MFLYFCLCSKNTIPVKLKGVHLTHTPTWCNMDIERSNAVYGTDTNKHYTTLNDTEELTKSIK